jgi:hypothetical protein
VASLATGVFRGFLACGNTPEMRILVEPQLHIGMAGFTDGTPDVIALGFFLGSSHQCNDKHWCNSEPLNYTSPGLFGERHEH